MQNENLKKQPESSVIRKATIAGAAGVAAVAGMVGVAKMNTEPSIPNPNEAHKVYIVKPYDTAWGISEKAYPNSDPRSTADIITKEEGPVLTPGEKVNLPESSHIGTEVNGSLSASSSG